MAVKHVFVPDTVLSCENKTVNERNKVPALMGLTFQSKKTQ